MLDNFVLNKFYRDMSQLAKSGEDEHFLHFQEV